MNKLKLFIFLVFTGIGSYAQNNKFTHGDTLRGSITPERAWWDVLKYDITVKPEYEKKIISGKTIIHYKVIEDSYPAFMQIDLQAPMQIDSVLFASSRKLEFTQTGNAWMVHIPKQKMGSENEVTVYFQGKPREAVRAPWDGGWIWTKDSLNRPWMTVACQGLGASVWYPCKDHQSDKPDNGATITMIIPDTLTGIGNGRLLSKQNLPDGMIAYTWGVADPINTYNIVPYIGNYVDISDSYEGEKGKLDINYWVLDYNVEKAKKHLIPNAHNMLKCFEHWFGPYPFYEDGYKLVDAPHLGMEHQSAVAYGNKYQNGYLGRDVSGSGWGLKWDFIVVHESGHEWFGNNITSKDIADMWVHEGFTSYSETLFTECEFGKKSGNEYNYGIRKNIGNKATIIGQYGVNNEGSSDMYYKGSNMLHTIRHSMDDDEKFRQILRGLNSTFYHQSVTTKQVENYISTQAGFDYNKVFDQYLRNIAIPQFEFYFSKNKKKVFYRWSNCINGFNLPLVLQNGKRKIKINPTEEWKSLRVKKDERALFEPASIEHQYYILAKQKT